jgi:pyruvate,water dikinase
VIEILQGYLAAADTNPQMDFAARAAEREEAVAEVRRRLRGYPSAVQTRFEELLERAQFCAVLREDHNFWMDFSCTCRVRRVMRAAGRHLLAADVIDTADDVFHLHLSEIVEALSDQVDRCETADSSDLRAIIASRRAEIEHFAAIEPPPQLGVEAPAPEAEETKPAAEPGVLREQPGAPGIVRARVVEKPSAARLLSKGDILVTVAMAPSFTPFFATLSGIVTDSGGLLSHCATVAREYRIAAVVGLDNACRLISDGQWIEIDGDRGIVRLIEVDES